MKYLESDVLELKLTFTSEIKKEVIAFLNTNGGKIIIGVDDGGKVIGVESPQKTMEQVASMICDSIKPDASRLCKIVLKKDDNKELVEIIVTSGVKKPYYIFEKGLKPSGVYIRIGNTSQPSSEDEIRSMLIERELLPFELMTSFEQELTFKSLKYAFEQESIELKYKTLKLKNDDGLYTNLALLLSDQNPFTIKAAIFDGDDKREFLDRKLFDGSLIKQADDVYAYLKLTNRNTGNYENLRRNDAQDYDNIALREAILNSIIHRDYSLSGSNLISIYNNRIEFVSIGGLVNGMTYQDMMLGVSRNRNEYLANVFFLIHYVEAYGTGIDKIMKSYKHLTVKPSIELSDNGFLIAIPNQNFKKEVILQFLSPDGEVLKFIKENGKTTRMMIQKHFDFKQTKTRNHLFKLEQSGQIEKMGNGKQTFYIFKR